MATCICYTIHRRQTNFANQPIVWELERWCFMEKWYAVVSRNREGHYDLHRLMELLMKLKNKTKPNPSESYAGYREYTVYI